MKLSTKLITLLGASALSFGALVPMVGANAAGTANGYVTGSDTKTTDLPASTSKDINDTTGTATGQSDAHVTVTTGYLTLMKVPDFNFGVVQPGTDNKILKNNEGLVTDDGNSDGILQVNDYRDGEDNASTGMGYTVTAQLGNFTGLADPDGVAGIKDTPAGTGNAAFTMNLNAVAGGTQSGTNTTDLTSTAVNLMAGTGGPETVLSLKAGTGYGMTSVGYMDSSAASLTVPAETAKGSYDAPITWTLAPLPSN
ncbi:WxL domain-containing protein [Loigolactobacillus jiayinensis]|uniref:WxL domain-containing protein n=1 Tax=Loigolactobacillus jiayinensis TaxID=2486016 RepID=A0ABW1RED1_9LACO|nr:WxL domain-containing protein [Loigolactobacillus jiayinensis]